MSDLARTLRAVLSAFVGTALVACVGGSSGGADLTQWSVMEEVRIGSASDPNRVLGEVSTLAVDGEGRIYVPQLERGTILVFDADGEPVGSIGRRGREPGQLDRVYGIGFIGDTLYAIDFGPRRISYFSTDGELLRVDAVSPPPVDPPLIPAMPFAVFPDGSMAIGTSWPASVDQEALRRVPQLRVDASWERADTVAWLGFERTARRAVSGGRPLPVGSPFADDAFAIFATDGTRLVSVDRTLPSGSGPATFGVAVSDGWGDTIYSRAFDYEPVEIPQAAIDRAVAAGAQRIQGAFESPADAEAFVRSAMFLPTHYPPVNAAVFSEDGALWLQREAISERPQRWMVLDDTGEHVADAELPSGLRVVVIRGDSLWGIVHDAGGVPFVVRYGIVRD